MSKPDRDEPQVEGERLLSDWGVSPSAAAEELGGFLGREPSADRAIARRLGALPSDASAALLQRLARETTDKETRKEIKRALYRLQQRGVRAAEPPTAKPQPVLTAPLEGQVSPVDGRGDQLVWLLKPRPDGLGHLFAVINDPDGLREIDFNIVTRKALKQVRAQLERKHDLRLAAADWHYCDFLMGRAFEWARQRDTSMSGDYPSARARMLKEPPPSDLPPLILSAVDAAAIRRDEGLLTRSVALLEEPEFRTWFLSPEEAKPYLDEVASARETPLVLNQSQQGDRLREIIDRAVAEHFGGERRASYGRRLFEMAYFLSATGRQDQARQAVAVALELAEGDRRPQDIPLCARLVQGGLAAWYQMEAEQENERAKTSLIMTPQQFSAQRQRR